MAPTNIKPITVYGHYLPFPNPPKVFILLKLLGIPYNHVMKVASDDPTLEDGIKHPNFTSINPNGRVPAIADPNNNNFHVWESGAILQYLAEIYDTDHKFSGKTVEERSLINQWIAFQISGQAPMSGQLIWFSVPQGHLLKYGEKTPDHVLLRFRNEVRRIYSVFNAHLEQQKAKGSDWIVGDRMTIADIAWAPWTRTMIYMPTYDPTFYDEFPAVKAWFAKMEEIPAVRETIAELTAPAPKN
ncbi:glutathione S- transferase, nitrogen catabolite repression regulator [Orbilia oligospora]|uniref:Glutathione S-transferase, nitrogen catabolite repression regulator n=1 Tax=Orbilia oligospora TaxID=2813651 RepID=A0A7C8PJM6_ORBOL|nr:glutathione S- transferase, nitrogen catabolite repression regulator [Orbilia oligospora]KAF3168161.1 glutathione S- transferase, nitrogen catabolite repression regulator [Orbilia oligospora]TGJ74996.1 glutathione S- transferase, nitrogen catabolite repression regulator [Orbilia oligospora]